MNPIILYENLIAKASVQSSAPEKGFDAKSVLDNRVYTRWKSSFAGSSIPSYIKFNSINLANDYYIGIAGHNLASSTIIIRNLYYVPIKTVTVNDNDPLLVKIENGSTIGLRVEFKDTVTKPEVGVIFAGNLLQFPFPPDAPFVISNEGIISNTLVSKSGKLLGIDHRFNPINISHRFSNLERSWIENEYSPFWNNHGKLLKPFFYAPDLENLPDEVYFCRFSEESIYSTQLSNLNYADSLQLNLVGTK